MIQFKCGYACSLWSKRDYLQFDAVFGGLLVLVFVLLSIQTERAIFVGGEALHRLLRPFLLRGMCFVPRV